MVTTLVLAALTAALAVVLSTSVVFCVLGASGGVIFVRRLFKRTLTWKSSALLLFGGLVSSVLGATALVGAAVLGLLTIGCAVAVKRSKSSKKSLTLPKTKCGRTITLTLKG